ncbi:TVP38/TMEM64 family protein [Cohaesibacter sp. CAU 1516]|uniref:TVP38/TMEM64 family protein n=1 Tax=Cohaesibacter sp. CAU 1516 TaxID=2576038 RepID=UPI001FEFA109|nr:TVP38/TMEM64 family protein [Cohaesibacter sp. CAU 1516]
MAEQMTHSAQNNSSGSGLAGKLKKWGPLIAIGGLMAFGFSQGWHHYLSLDSLVRHREWLASQVSAHYGLMLGGYMLAYILAVALSFPGASFLTIAGGLLFGWAIGGAATVLAATVGASVIFLATRSAFGASLRARAGGFVDRFSEGFRDNAFSYLLFLRLVPVFPFWLINVVPALFNVRLGVYFLATLVGILPGTFAYAFIGAGLDSIIAAQKAANPACATDPNCSVTLDTSALITPELIAAFVALGVVSLIPPALKAVKKWRGSKESS